MSAPLLVHLAQNLAVLELTEYTSENGKTRRLKDSGGTWLKVLMTICNFAQEPDRYCTAGWRALSKAAGTNHDISERWTSVFLELGWLVKRDAVRPEAGRRGKPANCYEVTLPGLPPKQLELMQPSPKPIAPVQSITEAQSKRAKRSGGAAALGQVVGSVVHQLHPEPLQHLQPVAEPVWSQECEAVMASARSVVLHKAIERHLSHPQQVIAVEQAAGSWTATYGKRTCPAEQVQSALAAGQCTDTQAVQYLASGLCHRTDLEKYLRGEN